MRTLTLAKTMRRHGLGIGFAMRALPGNLHALVEREGFPVFLLPGTRAVEPSHEPSVAEELEPVLAVIEGLSRRPAWTVVDHYGLDWAWERGIGGYCSGVFVIDDLDDRPHQCDVILDQNPVSVGRYDTHVPRGALRLLGPRYALVREEFKAARCRLRARDGQVGRILVSYGGVDPTGEAVKALAALGKLPGNFTIDAVLPRASPYRRQGLVQAARDARVRVVDYVHDMAAAMLEADLALGAGGTTTWERCFLGLPTIGTAVAENQRRTLQEMGRLGALQDLGDSAGVDIDALCDAISSLLRSPERLREMSRQALSVSEGYEAAEREIIDVFLTRLL